MKRGTPRHPKTRRLARELGVPIYAAVGLLEMLEEFVREFAPRGDVGRYTNAEIAEALGWDGGAEVLISRLLRSGILRSHHVGRLRFRPLERPNLSARVRREILARDGLTCGICWQPVASSDVHIDHIEPWSRGGSDDPTNLQVAHSRCNVLKRDGVPRHARPVLLRIAEAAR